MCEWGNTVKVEVAIPSHTGKARQTVVDVDRCIAPLVSLFNANGMPTTASCCGHGQLPGTILLADGRWVIIAKDFDEGRKCFANFPHDIHGQLVPPAQRPLI